MEYPIEKKLEANDPNKPQSPDKGPSKECPDIVPTPNPEEVPPYHEPPITEPPTKEPSIKDPPLITSGSGAAIG